MVEIPSAADANLPVKRLSAAQKAFDCRIALMAAERRYPDLFKRGSRLGDTCRDCDGLWTVTITLLHSKRASTQEALTQPHTQATKCALMCEECAEEAEKVGKHELADLVNAARQAARTFRDLAGMLRERGNRP